MIGKDLQSVGVPAQPGSLRRVRALLAPYACSTIVFGALFCNLAVKLFYAIRYGLITEYPKWVLTDIAVLVGIELVLLLVCSTWPKKWVLRMTLVVASLVCTWSVMNAGWLLRTGTQILPKELMPWIRDPLNITYLVLINIIRAPAMGFALLVPSGVALAFVGSVLVHPAEPIRPKRTLVRHVIVALAVVGASMMAHVTVTNLGSVPIASAGLRSNCQSRAVLSFILPEYRHIHPDDYTNATRALPLAEEMEVTLRPQWTNHNVVLVVLEGVQYSCTSLATLDGGQGPAAGDGWFNPTPYLANLASQGVAFTNARSVVTHTTKALFALLTGRRPAACQDIPETVPVVRPYASLATILKKGLGFRTAFFQSAKGTFESRPGLVHNLGFDKFYAREDMGDSDHFLGYLGSDEFAMLGPIAEWIRSDDTPFFLVVLCSVTHDPYEVPAWYAPTAETPAQRYQQAITYTDQFIAALDVELADLHLRDNTILCVAGDHGEAFEEHRFQGHERITYEEVLHIPICLRAPLLTEPGRRITAPVSSVDLAPTLLNLLGFETESMAFDGVDALAPLPEDRKVYFAGWMAQGPSGFIQGDNKFVYDPEHRMVSLYRLSVDPLELAGFELPENDAQVVSEEIVQWRRDTLFRVDQQEEGQTVLFGSWESKWWDGRNSAVKFIDPRKRR